jgi:hypothetical protein
MTAPKVEAALRAPAESPLQSHGVLKCLHERLMQCMALGLTVAEAYDSHYQAETELELAGAPQKYDDTLMPFLALMRRELHANAGKGDRPGWLAMDRKTALLEVHHHLAKLQKAVLSGDGLGVQEFAADVANMSMMVLDVCGGLEVAALTQPPTPTLPVEVHGKWYDVPIPVQVRMVALEDERDAFKTAMHEEIAENLRLRELGGAHEDENMVAFIERLIREATPQAPAVAVPHGWQLVPKNATNDMLRPFVTVQDMGHAEAWASWQAALAAAPQPPAQPQAVTIEHLPGTTGDSLEDAMKWAAQPQAHADLREALEAFMAATTAGAEDGMTGMNDRACRIRFYGRIDAVREKARAALSAPPPAQAAEAPEGWRLERGTSEYSSEPFVTIVHLESQLRQDFWKASEPMVFGFLSALAASPSPAASAEGKKSGAPSVRSRDEG